MEQLSRRIRPPKKMRESCALSDNRPVMKSCIPGLLLVFVPLLFFMIGGPGVELSHGALFRCRAPGGSVTFTNVPTDSSCRPYQLKKSYQNWSRKLDLTGVGSFDNAIRLIARRHNVDPPLVKAIIHTESDFNPRAVSKKGALGLMQLMPDTARELQVANPFNPQENIDGGTRYLRKLLDNFDNNLILSLAAYNAGPTLVMRTGGVPQIPETRRYINKVLRRYRHYRDTW